MENFLFIGLILGALFATFVFKLLSKAGPHPADQPQSHIFLDLETLGTKHDAPILVIAAVAVDSLGNVMAEMTARVRLESANQYGTADRATLAWWEKQDEGARFEAFKAGPRMSLPQALGDLTAFIMAQADPLVWGNSPTFDCAILRNAYAATGLSVPWEFWQERDCRTIKNLGVWLGHELPPFEGKPHVAINDARHQAKYTIGIINEIGGRV